MNELKRTMAMRLRPKPGRTGGLSRAESRGFSLTELLIVTALLAVLTALILPAINSAKERTKVAGCVTKLREIGMGMMLYASDNGGFPWSSHYDYWADWGESLIPYMEDGKFRNTWVPGETWANGLLKKVGTFQHLAHEVGQGSMNENTGQVTFPGWNYFTCPAGPKSKAGVPPWSSGWVHVYAHHYSVNEYVIPSNHNGNYVGGMPIPRVKPSQVERPGSVVMLLDSGVDATSEAWDTLPSVLTPIINDFVSNPTTAYLNGATTVTTPAPNDSDIAGAGPGWPIYARHKGRCNALMTDGHVQSFRNGELQRRNFVSKGGRTKRWVGYPDYVPAWYP